MKNTEKAWAGKFGNEYTDRNDTFKHEHKRLQFYNFVFKDEPKNLKILEVGCNIGENLNLLKKKGFYNLTGIDISEYALKKARKYNPDIEYKHGSILDIPFLDNQFDLVFTSGVLIHVHPDDLSQAIEEIYRCSKKYIAGLEFYCPFCKGYNYRNGGVLVWRNDFLKIFLKQFSDLIVIKKKFRIKNFRDWRRTYLLCKNVRVVH